MAKYATLKAAVEAAIRTNGAQQITGQVLQTQLVNMITSLGKYFQSFGGLATPAGSFTAGDESVTFLAVEAGTYTNFGGAVLDGKTLHILAYDGDWADVDTLIPSGAAFEAALALAIKGAHSGIAEGIADTISAGTAQEFLQRQSGGDGVNCIKRIKGKTIAWNQLVGPDTTEVTIPSGHKYFAIIGGAASVATSDGTAIAVTGGVDIVTDLTLLGLGDLTAAQFEALYPALYRAYNGGVLKSNDAAALLTDGRNQWDEVAELGSIDASTGQNTSSSTNLRSKNYIPVFAETDYFVRATANNIMGTFFCYDADKNYIGVVNQWGTYVNGKGWPFTTRPNTAYIRFLLTSNYGTTYANDICINLSDASFNGTYQPYWQRVLALRLSELTGIPEGGTEADRVTMFPNGAGGNTTSFDSIAEGKGNKRRARVNLGTLNWVYDSTSQIFYFMFVGSLPINPTNMKQGAKTGDLVINSKYALSELSINHSDPEFASGPDKTLAIQRNLFSSFTSAWFQVKDTAYNDAAAFKAAMSGVYLEYDLDTPIVYTDLQYADGTPFTMPATILVDNYGTERIQAPEGATTPSAPFCCDSNYSIGVANLVKRLAALENAE